MKLGEWAFSLERLTDSFCLHCQESFPKRIPKESFGRPLLKRRPFMKVSAHPGLRGELTKKEYSLRGAALQRLSSFFKIGGLSREVQQIQKEAAAIASAGVSQLRHLRGRLLSR
ncbi:MAG: hypothetical protein E7569_14595, partial [Ruminococcaceae bacterium]|nr:hypothetical protein [Oscillospiraceae bacterium]